MAVVAVPAGCQIGLDDRTEGGIEQHVVGQPTEQRREP
jgi:hypothetical protein